MTEQKTQITPEKTMKHLIAENYVDENIILLSALSWKAFKEYGRGYLYTHKCIDIEHESGNNFKEIKGVSPLEGRITYVAKDSEVWDDVKKSEAEAGQAQDWKSFYQAVDAYAPRYEFMIVVGMNANDRATEHSFHREPEIPPYKAFQMVRKRPQEFGIEKL